MKCQVTYQRHKPDTINGEILVVTTIYSSCDKAEIDTMEQSLKNVIGSGVIIDKAVK